MLFREHVIVSRRAQGLSGGGIIGLPSNLSRENECIARDIVLSRWRRLLRLACPKLAACPRSPVASSSTSFRCGPNRQELRRFIAGYLALLPLKKAAVEIDKRFVEYLLELSDGVTGRIIEILRRAAFQAIADRSQKVGLQQLQYVGARMPSAIGRRS
jgi:hypothetical protein